MHYWYSANNFFPCLQFEDIKQRYKFQLKQINKKKSLNVGGAGYNTLLTAAYYVEHAKTVE
jgi:hypothetical protein